MRLKPWIRRLRPSEWSGWPDAAYRQERYQQRLVAVESHLTESLDKAAPGPVRIISLCAGDGRDVVEVLRSHKRKDDVVAWLVELSRQSVALGVERAAQAGLGKNVKFLCGDATDFESYQRLAPADIVLACGVWGHVPASERATLARGLATLCKPGGDLIWTRGVLRGMSCFEQIQSLFGAPAWQRQRVSFTPDASWGIATARYCGPPLALPKSGRLFHFRRLASLVGSVAWAWAGLRFWPGVAGQALSSSLEADAVLGLL
jgi:SAM-dependent methyltransferase